MKSILRVNSVKFIFKLLAIAGIACFSLLFIPQIRLLILDVGESFILNRPFNNPKLWNDRLLAMAAIGVITSIAIFITIMFIDVGKLLDNFNKYAVATVLTIVLTAIYFLLKTVMAPVTVWGESDDFKIAGISVVNHFSTTITGSDIEQCRIEFPEEEFRLNDVFNGGGSIYNGKLISFYFPIYSIICLPVKAILSILPFDIPLNYSFLLTNIFLYCGMLIFVFFRLRDIPKLKRLIIMLLLAFSPAMEYINAPTYEVFLYSLVSCSAIQLYKKSFKSAALLGAIAASANIAISGFVFFIIITYFYNIFKSCKINLWVKQCLLNIKNIGLLALCCFPILLQLIYFKLLIGQFSPQQTDFVELSGIIPRFFAYFFDYNFSFFAYYPLLVILFFFGIGYSMFKRRFDLVLFCCGILFSMFLYGVIVHINCGQESLHRYNTHLLGAFLIISALLLFSLFPVTIKKSVYAGIISLFLANGIYLLNSRVPYTSFYPIPKLILNTIPQFYNPYPYTFISRIQHIDGGYLDLHEKPYFYLDNNGYIRKILITKESSYELINLIDTGKIIGNPLDIEKLQDKILKLKYNRYKNTNYINLSMGVNILNIE